MLRFADYPAHAQHILDAVRTAADPTHALTTHFNRALESDAIPTTCALIAVGKASTTMAAAALSHPSLNITSTFVIAVPNHPPFDDATSKRIDHLHLADHPLPTLRNIDAANALVAFINELPHDLPVLFLLSGGGSAHLTLPAAPLTLDHIRTITGALLRAGAPIDDLNLIRSHLEQLKAGRLAQRVAPRPLHVFILSDVLGDPLPIIASGPTAPPCPTPASYQRALDTLARYNLTDLCPPATAHLRARAADSSQANPPNFAHVTNTIIASNRLVVTAAADALTPLGFTIASTRHAVTGEARTVAADLVRDIEALTPVTAPTAIILGGETTVTVTGPGTGGRNQELALAAALALESRRLDRAAIITYATDGQDGPPPPPPAPPAAGALVTANTPVSIRDANFDPRASLDNNDAYTALAAANALVHTGPTGTNLNDIAVALLYPD